MRRKSPCHCLPVLLLVRRAFVCLNHRDRAARECENYVRERERELGLEPINWHQSYQVRGRGARWHPWRTWRSRLRRNGERVVTATHDKHCGHEGEEVAEDLHGGTEAAAARRDERGGAVAPGTETRCGGTRDCGLLQWQRAAARTGGARWHRADETMTTLPQNCAMFYKMLFFQNHCPCEGTGLMTSVWKLKQTLPSN